MHCPDLGVVRWCTVKDGVSNDVQEHPRSDPACARQLLPASLLSVLRCPVTPRAFLTSAPGPLGDHIAFAKIPKSVCREASRWLLTSALGQRNDETAVTDVGEVQR